MFIDRKKIVKILSPNLIYRFNSILIKISKHVFTKVENMILKRRIKD